jgi:DeoR/GlpR family transcriptional regulator of sugar metabolism
MKPHERQTKILELLRQKGYVAVEDLSQAMDVSNMTIRRDLDQLQQMELIVRHYGGATLAPEERGNLDHKNHAGGIDSTIGASLAPERDDLEWPLLLRETLHLEEKQKIGKAAAAFVRDDDVIVMDAGTTTIQVAKRLVQNRLTVITNFLPILCLLSTRDNIELIGVGGTLARDNQWFTGRNVIDNIRGLNANIAIMATTGLSLSKGLTNRNIHDSEIKRTMIEIAEKIILVADSSKIHRHTLATVGPLDLIDILVTDDGLSAKDIKAIEAKGVEVVIAD